MYDPRQVSESLVWCAEPHKKFIRATQSQIVDYSKHNFWNTSETFLQNRVAKILFYIPNCLALSGPRNFLWGSAHQTKLSNTYLRSYLRGGENFVTIPCLERILSHKTCKHSDFWIFILPGNPILKFEKAPKWLFWNEIFNWDVSKKFSMRPIP